MTTIQLDPRLRANIVAAIKEADEKMHEIGFGQQNTENALADEASDFLLIYHLGVMHGKLHDAGMHPNMMAYYCTKFELPFNKEDEGMLYPAVEPTT